MIPDGYKISNPEAADIDKSHEADGETTMAFVSKGKLDGNKFVITIDEYYTRLDYAVELFEDYQTIINAAADFNKVVLFLEKQ